MSDSSIQIGDSPVWFPEGAVEGEYATFGTETFYRIANFDRMAPFFMSIVSASNHWLFLSSRGGLTAGRQDADNALFPYYTEDKIHDGSAHTGSTTLLRVRRDGRRYLWEPFAERGPSAWRVRRNLYKNVCGNKVVFEEINEDLEAVFRYMWTTSERFGFVKRSEILNEGAEPLAVEVLDGLENLLPWGLADSFQNQYSCLGDAYKQSEIDLAAGLATFALSSRPGDSPEPGEALRATVCWSSRGAGDARLLSSRQLDVFRQGLEPRQETRVCGRRGSFFVRLDERIAPGGSEDWCLVADVGYGHAEIATLVRVLQGPDAGHRVQDDVEAGTRALSAIVAGADGLQRTGDRLGSAHHFANVLFNVMRGGVFESGYSIATDDVGRFVRAFNRGAWARNESFLGGLGERVGLGRLLEETRAQGDEELLRLVSEYLPLSFSRRHGDPSRPWNRFSINVRARDGSRLLDYQGNWRDIFQNWEALCVSFPGYLDGAIGKFVNTTTADGHNPYRVMRDGYDWEAPDPDDPWAHFGYWGDHQLIYLLKFLELSRSHQPGALEGALREARFVYADVPYDIKPHEELIADPKNSIVYNVERAAAIADRVAAVGFDGRYLTDDAGRICRASLAEKLLVPLLAKVCNFVPGGGFWLNTQRPEWNDANNALAGFGASVVTLCYARRYVSFCLDLFAGGPVEEVELNEEVVDWLAGARAVLEEHRSRLTADRVGDGDRKAVLDGLGKVASRYRAVLYANGLGGRTRALPTGTLIDFLELVRDVFDRTIAGNRRDDGLYHAYNVLEISAEAIGIHRLDAMLEGQVAVLSSGALDAAEAASVLRALRESDLYRQDQHSYLLYPDRALPGFLEKNRIPAEAAESSLLLAKLVSDGNTDLVEAAVDGRLHFNGLFRNVRDVRETLDRLGDEGYADLVEQEAELVEALFEAVFEHRKFTGRSGTFYGYEGLGCIYWHMVSKLLLAVQETCLAAHARDDAAFADLAAAYYDVRAGLGFNKSPDVYGAFPTDPYSHTPGFAGARQPGMTGQVKEEILTRFGELGLFVREGRVLFDPVLLRSDELAGEAGRFDYYDVAGRPQSLEVEEGALVFTYCQVPVVYRRSEEPGVTLVAPDGARRELSGLTLDEAASRELFERTGTIARVEVMLTPGLEMPFAAQREQSETVSAGKVDG